MLWRALHEDLQARCFKPVRAPRLTAESRLARLNFCRGVLRVGVLSINEHSQRNPGTMVGAAMVNGTVFPPCFIEEGVLVNTECCIRMLDNVYLPHCMARLGTDTSSRWWQKDNNFCEGAQNPVSHVASVLARLESIRFSPLARVETALADRQFTSQLRATIVRAVSALDPEAELTRTSFSGLVRPVLKHGPKSLTVDQFFLWVLEPASACLDLSIGNRL